MSTKEENLILIYEQAIQEQIKKNDYFIKGFPKAASPGGVSWQNNAAESILRAAVTEFCCPDCARIHLENILLQITPKSTNKKILNRKELQNQIMELAKQEVDAVHSDIDWSKMGEQDCSNYRKEIIEHAVGILLN